MKKLTIILVLIFTIQQSFSYTWESYGPEGIKTENLILLNSSYAHSLICSDSGMFINTGFPGPNWEYFDFAAKDACLLNNDTVLIILSEGWYSDGIYSLNLQTFELNIIEYCINPNYIKHNEYNDTFYVGYEYGMLKSDDGLNWTEASFFSGKDCKYLAFNNDHLISYINIAYVSDEIYLSDNGGVDWTEANNNFVSFSDIIFYSTEEVYAAFTPSNSAGLWHSTDYGNNWTPAFYSDFLFSICNIDYSDKILLGWYDFSKWWYVGIAIYDPNAPEPGLTFLNEGLPNTNINKIKYEALLGGAIIYACTDNGVYLCHDYFVGIDEQPAQKIIIDIFPNPITNQTTINVNLTESRILNTSIFIYNNEGLKVDEIKIGSNPSPEFTINWDKGNLPAGIYYLTLKTKKGNLSKKIVIL